MRTIHELVTLINAGLVEEAKRFILEESTIDYTHLPIGVYPLHDAIKQGSLELVEMLLKKGCRLDWAKYGFYPLHEAVISGREDMVKLLIQAPYDAGFIIDDSGETVFHSAIAFPHLLPFLYQHFGPKYYAISSRSSTRNAFLEACSRGNREAIVFFMQHNAPIDSFDGEANTAFHLVLDKPYLEKSPESVVALLTLLLDASPSHRALWTHFSWAYNVKGESLLHIAAKRFNVLAIDLLLKKAGLGVDNKNLLNSMTPLHAAVFQPCDTPEEEKRQIETIKQLVDKHEATIFAKDNRAFFPIHYAINQNLDYVVHYFISKTLDKQLSTLRDVYPELLHHAATINLNTKKKTLLLIRNSFEYVSPIIQQLVAHGYSVNETNNLLNTPLHIAAMYKNEMTFKSLLTYEEEAREAMKMINHYGDTVLHCAVKPSPLSEAKLTKRLSCEKIVKKLLDYNEIKLEAKNNEGKTALDICVEQGLTNLVQMMLNSGRMGVEDRHSIIEQTEANNQRIVFSESHDWSALFKETQWEETTITPRQNNNNGSQSKVWCSLVNNFPPTPANSPKENDTHRWGKKRYG